MRTVVASLKCIYRRTAIHSVPPSFSEDPNILRDLVHLDEDFGKGGLEVKPLACVRRSVCGMLYADNVAIVPKSMEDLAKMTVIVTPFESAGLTVPKRKRRQCCSTHSTRFSRPHRSLSKRRARDISEDDAFCVPGRGLINECADIMP